VPQADLTADAVLSVIRVHADRVHDAVRRLGCDPEAAFEVVQQSALDLISAAAAEADSLDDPVGWWFARARTLARSVAGGDDDLPVGGGVLGGDANQQRLAEALEARPERERAALLLRDSYDLPASAVGISLGLDATGAMEVVGAARLAFLPTLLGGEALSLGAHVADLAALSRLAEGGHLAARDATTRRHVQSCELCGDVVDAQERARRLLSGLTVVALPETERDALLTRAEAHARDRLPAAEPVFDDEDDDDEDGGRRGYSLSLMALGLVVAVGAGLGLGLLVSRSGNDTQAVGANSLPLVTAAPVLTFNQPPATIAPTLDPSTSPTPRTFVITPSPAPSPTATAAPTSGGTPTPTISAEPLALQLSPSSGPNNTEITVNGAGWTPGATVTLQYLQQVDGTPGSTASAVVDERGRFTTTLTAHDQSALPGDHRVTANDGTNSSSATFTAN
jgi:DNA-directed RNA polymerase specialized sigma24 family protein